MILHRYIRVFRKEYNKHYTRKIKYCTLNMYHVCTGCPNKHGNSVKNSISSFLNNSLIPTEKAVRVSSAMFTFVYITCPSSPSSLLILGRHYRHIFAVFYPFHEINSSRHNNIMGFEIRITMLIHNKDDIEFVTEFPCFLGHPVCPIIT